MVNGYTPSPQVGKPPIPGLEVIPVPSPGALVAHLGGQADSQERCPFLIGFSPENVFHSWLFPAKSPRRYHLPLSSSPLKVTKIISSFISTFNNHKDQTLTGKIGRRKNQGKLNT